jgi:CheY-like chemotaxis protein
MRRSGLKILLVDDNQAFIDGLGELLSDDGHTVRVCYRGTESLELAPLFVPDLVFLDLTLPDMDGGEVARRLHTDPALAATKLVSLSGCGPDLSGDGCDPEIFFKNLAKPVKIEALEKLIAGLTTPRD